MDTINLDANASTPVQPEVWEAMRPYMLSDAGNPASSHSLGRRARRGLEEARETVATLLDAGPDEVVFTSGATEANNLAIFGLAGDAAGTIISSGLEHPSVAEPVQQLARRGFRVLTQTVSHSGQIEPLPPAAPVDLRLACLMLANHETGTVQPVEGFARALGAQAPVHCDAAAAAGKMPISFRRLGVATLTISAHKFHGPKGIGALVVRKGTRLGPQLFGGHQQHGLRPGTETVALAVGLACALDLRHRHLDEERNHVAALRHRFLELLRHGAAPFTMNGGAETLPHTVNVSFPGCGADALLMNLDLVGVACSTGSACSSGSLLPSPVLRTMGVPDDLLRSAMRFSFSCGLTLAEIEDGSRRIISVVNRLRHSTASSFQAAS